MHPKQNGFMGTLWKIFKKNRVRILLIFVIFVATIGLTSIVFNSTRASGQNKLETSPLPFFSYITPGPPHGNMATEAIHMTLLPVLRTTEAYHLSLPTPTEPNLIDLSPDLPETNKFEVWVQHSDGTFTRYYVGPLPDYKAVSLSSSLLATLNLQQGDKIVYIVNLGMKSEMGAATATQTWTPVLAKPSSTETRTSYPYPVNTPFPSQISTSAPYPIK